MLRHWSARQRMSGNGFTLIEMLIVIAIIALLIGILLPAMGSARKHGRMVYDQGVLKQQVTAYASYLADYKDQTLPAAPHWAWAHETGASKFWMSPGDPFEPGTYLVGSITKVWTWHFVSAVNYALPALQIDKPTFNDFIARPHDGSGAYPAGADSSLNAFAYHPSFGMNGVYVGGAYTHGGFRGVPASGQTNGNSLVQGGNFYVTNASKVRWPQKLIIFADSRAGDVREGNLWGAGVQNPDTGDIRPGYFIVLPPRPHPVGRGMPGLQIGGGWSASNRYDPNQPPSRWGMVEPRYFGRAATGMFDGHVESQTLEQLRDMRKWCNFATTADWDFTPVP